MAGQFCCFKFLSIIVAKIMGKHTNKFAHAEMSLLFYWSLISFCKSVKWRFYLKYHINLTLWGLQTGEPCQTDMYFMSCQHLTIIANTKYTGLSLIVPKNKSNHKNIVQWTIQIKLRSDFYGHVQLTIMAYTKLSIYW